MDYFSSSGLKWKLKEQCLQISVQKLGCEQKACVMSISQSNCGNISTALRGDAIANHVPGCDFTAPLFISTVTPFQSAKSRSGQASSQYPATSSSLFLLCWFIGLGSIIRRTCVSSSISSAIVIIMALNKNTQLYRSIIFTQIRFKLYVPSYCVPRSVWGNSLNHATWCRSHSAALKAPILLSRPPIRQILKSINPIDRPSYRVLSFTLTFHTNKTNSVDLELPIILRNMEVLVTMQWTVAVFCQ